MKTNLARIALAALLLSSGAMVARSQPAATPPASAATAPLVTQATATNCADLTGLTEVPPVTGVATGVAWVAVDDATGTIRWWIWFEGLTGAATGAHVHGPAAAGENAGVIIDLGGGGPIVAPLEGETTLTAVQVEQVKAGQWYVNVHTAANPDGEIRGQLNGIPTLAAAPLAVPGAAGDVPAGAAAEMMNPVSCALNMDFTENPVGLGGPGAVLAPAGP